MVLIPSLILIYNDTRGAEEGVGEKLARQSGGEGTPKLTIIHFSKETHFFIKIYRNMHKIILFYKNILKYIELSLFFGV